MAGYFPSVDFSILGDLPSTIDAAQQRSKSRETLADLKSGDADSLISKGAQLMSVGNVKEGLSLIAEGRQRKAIEQRSEELKLYLGTLGKQQPVPIAPQPATPDVTTFGNPTPAAPAAPGPDPFAGAPASIGTVIGPQTSLPPLSGAAAAALAPDQTAPSPSDQMIAAAQGGSAPPASGPQLAGPPPTIGGPAPLAPQVPGPELLRGAQAPAFTTQQPGAPPAPPAAPKPPAGFPMDPAVQQEVQALQQQLNLAVSNKYGGAAVRGIQLRLKAAIDKGTWDKDTKSFMQDQTDRLAEGLPPQNRSVWEATKSTQGEVIKDARKIYEGLEASSEKATDLASKLELMDNIAKNPNFIAGTPGKLLAHGASVAGGVWDALTAAGVNMEALTGRRKEDIPLMKSAQLNQVFQALSNQAVVTSLGTLGNQISNSDRDYINAAYPGLAGTKEGTQLLIQVMREAAKHAQVTGNAARMYIKNSRGKEDSADLRDAIDTVRNSRSFIYKPDGSFTDLGQKIEDLKKISPVPGAGSLPGANRSLPAPPPDTAPIIQPGQIFYRGTVPYTMGPNGPVPVPGGGT